MRDALSLLDQILACGESQMDEGYVLRLLGTMDRQVLFDISEAVFARDISRVLAAIETVYQSGQDLKRFYGDLLTHFRHLMLIKLAARAELLGDLTAEESEKMARQVDAVSVAYLDQVFTLLFNAETGVRHASQPRLAIEIAFFKIHQITPALPIDVLIERLDGLLKQAPLAVGTGIVEAQTGYGPTAQLPHGPSVSPGDPGPPEAAQPTPPGPPNAPDAPEVHDSAADANGWRRVVAIISERKPSIAAALSRAKLDNIAGQTIRLTLAGNDYSLNMVKKNLAMIESVCLEQTGCKVHFDFSGNADHEKNAAVAKTKVNEIRKELLNHPLVADTVEIFNGKIEEIKIK